MPQWLWDDVFVPYHHTCCYGAQMRFGKKSPNLTPTRSHAIQILHSPTSQSFCAALSVQLHAKYLSVNMLDPLNLYDTL